MRRSTGTWSASLLPPVKLYLGNLVHLAAGAGKEGANRGAKSNGSEAMPCLSFFKSMHRARASRHGSCGRERRRRRSLFVIHRCELRHDLALEQFERAHFLRVGERAEGQHQHEIILPDALGLGGEDARDRVGASHHQGARGLRLVVVGRDRDRRERAALDPQPGEAVEPALIGRPRDALGLGVGIGNEDRAHHAAMGRLHRRLTARAVGRIGPPVRAEGRKHVRDLLVRPERHAVHAVARRKHRTLIAAQPVPQRRMRALQRPDHDRDILEGEAIAAVVDALLGEALVENIQDVLVVGARLLEIDAIGVELHGRDAAPHADVEAAAAEMIEHAELFQQPQRMVERQEIEQRAEPDAPRFARGGGQKYARRRRHRQRRRVMLGEVVTVKAGGLGRLQQGEPVLVGLLQRLPARVDVIEDAELHVAFPPPLRRIFGRNRRRRIVLTAKPSIGAVPRLSPSRGAHRRPQCDVEPKDTVLSIMGVAPSDLAVIVTGGARGLGRAMALGLAKAGVRVAVADLPSSRADMRELADLALAQQVEERIHRIDCDVTRWADCTAAVRNAVERFGAVHGLVNNAGVGMQHIGNVLVGARKKFYEVDADTWRNAIDVNFSGPFMMAKAIAPTLVAQGWGRIVNIETSSYTMMMEGFSPYGPSKAALEAATVVWAKDLAGTGVTVNALAPGGPANTRMIPATEVADRSTLIQPQVMIAPIVWLISARSDGVSGRRIIAKEWDAARLASEPAEKVGTPAGW